MDREPKIRVGIVRGAALELEFSGSYTGGGPAPLYTGRARVSASGDRIAIDCGGERRELPSGVLLSPHASDGSSFVIREVTIGVGFHWERKEDQRFRGSLEFLRGSRSDVVAINVVTLEEYLTSVISSEMSPRCSLNLLQAHAITSRSWLLAQLQRAHTIKQEGKRPASQGEDGDRRIRWYDREDHLLFDVCADDHCQRYRGITDPPAEAVVQAVGRTRGLVIAFEGTPCDARFSKCCGGITEPSAHVWQNVPVPYLVSIPDRSPSGEGRTDVSSEAAVREWVGTHARAFCNTSERKILEQVLPSVDQETLDFFRWSVLYSQEELSEIIRDRSGLDFGRIIDLLPVERGPSGRLILLSIVGEKRTLIIGKELEIRRTLSRSHLKSSAFVVEKADLREGVPGKFMLRGAGWGHGVGLCQIGAAVMGELGYAPEEILAHYFPGTELLRLY